MVLDVWVTKFVLTQGIFKCKAEVRPNDDLIKHIGADVPTYYLKPFWHLTEKEAQEHARHLKEQKLKNLRKQIDKIEKMEF